jgi:peptide/nickel transport system substrate-binding protein
MKRLIGKILKFSFYSFFLIGFTWVSAQLFFEDQTNEFLASVTETDELNKFELKELSVVYASEPVGLEPTLMDSVSRQALLNIYEPLVKFDRDLTPTSSLALSWGLIDDNTWEFKIRPDVRFHDGTEFGVGDVVASFDRAFAFNGSEVRSYLNSISSYSAIDDYTFRIKTLDPDPLLLQKVSNVLIVPEEIAYDPEVIDVSVGTASYQFDTWEKGDRLYFDRFNDYWGERSVYEEVEMIFRINKIERVNMLLSGEAHFLGFVPFDAVDYVLSEGFNVTSIPSLEVQFLLFNVGSKHFKDVANRKAFNFAIDRESFTEIVGGYARPVNQFVSNGVFGFSPVVDKNVFDPDLAAEIFVETGLEDKTVHFHLPIGLDLLGEHVRTHLADVGVNVVVSYLEIDKLMDSIENRDADIYFFGFKSDNGDASDFFNVVVKTDGEFNAAGYSSSDVDSMIAQATTSMNLKNRIEILHSLMKLVVDRDRIGVPLFEYETLYSFIPELNYDPRVDGFIYFDEIKIKQ